MKQITLTNSQHAMLNQALHTLSRDLLNAESTARFSGVCEIERYKIDEKLRVTCDLETLFKNTMEIDITVKENTDDVDLMILIGD